MELGTQVIERDQLESQCQVLSRMGIQVIELGHEILPSRNSSQLEQLAGFLAELSIEVRSVHAPFGRSWDLSCADDEQRHAAVAIHRDALDRMELVDAKYLIVHPGDRVSQRGYRSHWRSLRESLEMLLPLAEHRRIVIALENLPPGFVGDSSKDLRELVLSFDSPYLRVCFDTGHAHINGGVEQDYSTLQDVVASLHIHDNDGVRDLHLQPPYGTIAWDRLITLIERSPYQGPLMLECFPWGQIDYAWVKREIELAFAGCLTRVSTPYAGYVRCSKCGRYVFSVNGKSVCYCTRELDSDVSAES
jgi:sugar phosphate isomerase/epimerase